MSTEFYEVVYYTAYGGFGYPKELYDTLDKLYPPESEFGKKIREGNYFDFREDDKKDNPWRTSPEIIQILRENNWITNKKYRTQWAIAKIPIEYKYRITEYDGEETVHIVCPTSEIITDLLNIIENKKPTIQLNKLTQELLSKHKTIEEVLNPTVKDE